METKDEITVAFPPPIPLLRLPVTTSELLTCESALLQCLDHIKDKIWLETKDIGVSTYLPALGLRILSFEEKTYLPLHYVFHPQSHHQHYQFCVRHRPIHSKKNCDVQLFNFVWEILILQAIDDFLRKELSSADNAAKDLKKYMTLELAALGLTVSNAPYNDKKIGKEVAVPQFPFFGHRRQFSPQFVKRLTKSTFLPNQLFDYIFYYKELKKKILEIKGEERSMGNLKRDFIINLLKLYPSYCLESYQAKICQENGPGEECCVRVKLDIHGQEEHLGLYVGPASQPDPTQGKQQFKEPWKCWLTKIERVLVKKSSGNTIGQVDTVIIETENIVHSIGLVFNDPETLASFISMLQGLITLTFQQDLYLNRDYIPPSARFRTELRSFCPMSHEEAQDVLWKSNYMKNDNEKRSHLLYQDKDEPLTFNVASGVEDQPKWCVKCSPPDKFIIHKDGEAIHTYQRAVNILKFFNGEFKPNYAKNGCQLSPEKYLASKKQEVNSSSFFRMPLPARTKNEIQSGRTEVTYILEKDLDQGSKLEIANDHGHLKYFRIVIDQSERLLLELQSMENAKARDALSRGVNNLQNLAAVSPAAILQFYKPAFLQKDSFVFEYPTHGRLSSLLTNNQNRLSWHFKMTVCVQIVGALKAIEQSPGIYHGNIRSCNFYVFIFEGSTKPVVKLGDPGMAYMYDDPTYECNFLNERCPWLAPERLKDPQRINVDTECYSIGTTLCEVMHQTDDFKKLLNLETDSQLLEFFKNRQTNEQDSEENNKQDIPAPSLTFSSQDPNAVTEDVRQLVNEAWKGVKACWHDDPSERPTAHKLTSIFKESMTSLSELESEYVMDFIEPMLQSLEPNQPHVTAPKDINALMKKQTQHFIDPEQVEPVEGDRLGTGHFGLVKKYNLKKKRSTETDDVDRVLVAGKTLKKTAKTEGFIREVDVIAGLNHDNIVKFLHFTIKQEKVILLMEFLEEGTLLDFVRKVNPNEKKFHHFVLLLTLSQDVAKGMAYLHSQSNAIIHCDLAARNVLLYKDTQQPITKFTAKVSDFGLAKILKFDQDFYYNKDKDVCLPFFWNPPEYNTPQLQNGQTRLLLHKMGDVWSYGVLLWEVFTLGRCPSKALPGEVLILYEKLEKGFRLRREDLVFDDPRIYKELMVQCWQFCSDDRPSFAVLNDKIQTLLESLNKDSSCLC